MATRDYNESWWTHEDYISWLDYISWAKPFVLYKMRKSRFVNAPIRIQTIFIAKIFDIDKFLDLVLVDEWLWSRSQDTKK